MLTIKIVVIRSLAFCGVYATSKDIRDVCPMLNAVSLVESASQLREKECVPSSQKYSATQTHSVAILDRVYSGAMEDACMTQLDSVARIGTALSFWPPVSMVEGWVCAFMMRR